MCLCNRRSKKATLNKANIYIDRITAITYNFIEVPVSVHRTCPDGIQVVYGYDTLNIWSTDRIIVHLYIPQIKTQMKTRR